MQEFGPSCTGNRNERKATQSQFGAGEESFPEVSPQSLCHSRNAATGRDKSLTLQRPQARPARLLPRCGTGTRAVSRLQRFSSHQATACSHDSARWCWSASVRVTKRPALPAHPNSESPLSLAQNCQGQQRLFGAKAYSRKGRENRGLPRRHEANSPLIADGARGEISSIRDLGRKPRSRSTRPRNPHYSRWCSAPEVVLRKALIAGNTAPCSRVRLLLSVLGGLLGLVPAAHRLVDRVPMT